MGALQHHFFFVSQKCAPSCPAGKAAYREKNERGRAGRNERCRLVVARRDAAALDRKPRSTPTFLLTDLATISTISAGNYGTMNTSAFCRKNRRLCLSFTAEIEIWRREREGGVIFRREYDLFYQTIGNDDSMNFVHLQIISFPRFLTNFFAYIIALLHDQCTFSTQMFP